MNIKYDESINSEYIEILNQFKNFKFNKKKFLMIINMIIIF